MDKHVTLTVVFEGANLNYGETKANLLTLKKMSAHGRQYSYVSRQALRYDLVRVLHEDLGAAYAGMGRDGKVVQFEKEASILDCVEIDLFGYLKTGSNARSKGQDIRKAVVRLTDALSLEPYLDERDFASNMGLARRLGAGNSLFQAEMHKSFYTYSLTLDLARLGVDDNYQEQCTPRERYARCALLLDAVKLLHRDIRGKRENLSPCLIIGGMYTSGNPFFYNRIQLSASPKGTWLDTELLNEVLSLEVAGQPLAAHTRCGQLTHLFANTDQLKVERLSIEQFFQTLKAELAAYFQVERS